MAAWKLAVCVAGIWSCFFVYGILQESIFVYRTPSGEKFKETMVLLIVEHTVSALVALAIMTFFTGSSSSWRPYLKSQGIVACAQCGAKFASNEALKSVSYPIQALAKSSKTLPAMLGCLWSGKRITTVQWVAAIGITLGTAGFSMSGKKNSDIEAKPLGVLLLVLSLLCDGTVSAAQQSMRNQVNALSPYEQMFMTNLGAALILLPVSLVFGQLQTGLQFLVDNITILDEIAIFALCSAFGQVFIFLTIAWFGPDTNAKITTVRKMATVLISIVWFGHSIDTAQWAFVGLVFASVFAEISEKLFQVKPTNGKANGNKEKSK
ncbi:unnamed protein product [Effrenium voratum]|uniref:Uncharacterized protein n=1 Tax=Effrenium voratum TaxID=2562239 RepID=A0AA36I5F6_9DINO|nr:unnamed protein product [Effrenium voratum]CAJ1419102.1 unnamed protein product [Effrenium voratum]